MQLRSGRRLSRPRAPAPCGQRRHRPAPPLPEVDGAGGDMEEDRISSLPHDLLLAVLVRLGCAWEAARTSILARRWRALWTQLPELVFDRVPFHEIEASLAQVTRPTLDLLCIAVIFPGETAGRVSSLLRDIAERLAPKVLSISYDEDHLEGSEKIKLPCFRTTTTLLLHDHAHLLALPPAGNIADLVPMCPSLRYLDVPNSYGEVIIHSPSLEELYVDTDKFTDTLWVIDIRAPLLKKATFDFRAAPDSRVSFSAPTVKKIFWHCRFEDEYVGLPCMRISFLGYFLRRGFHKLCLHIVYLDDFSDEADRSFAQEVAQLPLLHHNLSVLKLELNMMGHGFAPLVLHVLQVQPVIKALNVELTNARQKAMQCPLNCPCEQPNVNWRNENLSLSNAFWLQRT